MRTEHLRRGMTMCDEKIIAVIRYIAQQLERKGGDYNRTFRIIHEVNLKSLMRIGHPVAHALPIHKPDMDEFSVADLEMLDSAIGESQSSTEDELRSMGADDGMLEYVKEQEGDRLFIERTFNGLGKDNEDDLK